MDSQCRFFLFFVDSMANKVFLSMLCELHIAGLLDSHGLRYNLAFA